ncbi:putative deoxyribonuclease TATDN2 [Galendromus occidentalis]|uniref:Deoxyribonuclease TATDN2 n=1 Tax=Galendromus occidentalis TaxID=34638 RepID=A0AAJ7P9W0_9ACAR|nr:putative deoxyribonuclease TATDN2 [Galendromus occidentalis]
MHTSADSERRHAASHIDLKVKNSLTDIDARDSAAADVSTGKLGTVLHGIDINTKLTTGLLDTHTHIDFTLNTHNSHESSWKDFFKRFSARFPSCYEGAIAAFCQPNSLTCSSPMLNEVFQDERIWMTFGIHPHFSDQYSEDALRACLHKFKTKIVALGEIGLDTSKKNHVSLEVQKEVFRSQAEIGIENGLPLVIHTRVHDNNEETLMFMRKFVPRHHKIHRHCFTGTWDEANDWLSHFKNCYIGFTTLINTQSDLMKVAARIPFDRILLETDSPYFKNGLPSLHDGGRPVGTMPGDVIYTAVGVAKARGIPLEAVICQCRLNAKSVFGI